MKDKKLSSSNDDHGPGDHQQSNPPIHLLGKNCKVIVVHIIILMPSVIDDHVPDIPHSVLILVKQAEAIVIPCSLICMLPPHLFIFPQYFITRLLSISL